MRREYLGWIAAGVVAAVLGGLLGWQLVEDDGGRRLAAIDNPPPDIPADVQQMIEEKREGGRNPDVPNDPPRVGAFDPPSCNESDPPNVNMIWRFRPDTKDKVKNKAKVVVTAEVQSVTQAEDLVLEARGEPGGEERIPRQEIVLNVEQSHKGGKKQGDEIRVTKYGGPCFRPDDDPAYEQGQRYLLALEDDPKARGKFRTISPEGRYGVNDDGTLSPVAHESAVANEIAQMRVAEAGRDLGGG
jgi:hypothetical protein